MFEYLTNKDYREAKNNYSKAKSNVNKLKKIKSDLSDDSRSISNINSRINSVYDNFQKMVKDNNCRSRVKNKLDYLYEPYQSNDNLIINAVDCIDYEIGNQNTKMKKADNTMSDIKNNDKSGGGSW